MAGASKSLYAYEPSAAAASIFAALFLLTTSFHVYQMVRTRTWFFTAFIMGGALETIGYCARTVNARQTPDWAKTPYIIQAIGTLLAPTLFAASIYMELGRIIVLVDGEKFSIVRVRWMTKIFVLGDVISFVLQGIGGSMLASGSLDKMDKGERFILIGLWVQIVFFGLFLANSLLFLIRIQNNPSPVTKSLPWKRHLVTLFVASGFILIRSIFRVVEYIQGRGGELMSKEIYLYSLDAALMFLTMIIFHLAHPSGVIGLHKGGKVAFLFRIYTVSGRDDTHDGSERLERLRSRSTTG